MRATITARALLTGQFWGRAKFVNDDLGDAHPYGRWSVLVMPESDVKQGQNVEAQLLFLLPDGEAHVALDSFEIFVGITKVADAITKKGTS